MTGDAPRLNDTVIEGEAEGRAFETLAGELKARGERHATRRRVGCAFAGVGTAACAGLLIAGKIWTLGVLAFLVFVAVYYTSTLDPELEDDARLDVLLAIAALAPEGAALKVWVELNAYDMAVADARRPAAGGTEALWQQNWLRVEGDAWTLKAEVHARQLVDGIAVLEAEERQRYVLEAGGESYELDTKGPPSAGALRGWLQTRLAARGSASVEADQP